MAAQHESITRIADYLQVIKDKTWVINTPAVTLSPQINIPPIQVVVQQIDTAALDSIGKAIGDAVAAAVASAIERITLSPQITVTGGSGGGCDGNCGGTCGDLMCVIAPWAASSIQANKAVISQAKSNGFWTETGEKWPDPSLDSDPPVDYTPYLEGETAPPSGYTTPPGGMNGGYDPVSYAGYKCDVAWYLVDYLIAYYESWLETVSQISTILDMLSLLEDFERMGAAIESRMAVQVVVYDVVATTTPTTLAKSSIKVSGKTIAKVVGLLIEAFSFLFNVLETVLPEHISYLKTRRKAMACGLVNGTTPANAVDRLNKAAAKLWIPTVDLGQGYSAWKPINAAILGDLPQNLFACQAGADFSPIEGYGTLYGEGCEGCSFNCDGATLIIDFDNGKQGWTVVNPPSPDTSYGDILGDGWECPPGSSGCDGETSTGLKGFKQSGSVTIVSGVSRTFTQICVKFGGHGSATNNIEVYVNDVLAMSRYNVAPTREEIWLTESFNIEDDKLESYPNQNLVNNKFSGVVKIVRTANASIGFGRGEARVFGVAFG